MHPIARLRQGNCANPDSAVAGDFHFGYVGAASADGAHGASNIAGAEGCGPAHVWLPQWSWREVEPNEARDAMGQGDKDADEADARNGFVSAALIEKEREISIASVRC